MAFDHSACPHCRRLREELEEAREELRQEREVRREKDWTIARASWLRPSGRNLLEALVNSSGVVGSDRLIAAMRSHVRITKEDPLDPVSLLKAQMCRLRKDLAPHGIHITTIWGEGYEMDAESKRKAKMLGAEKERATEAAQIPQPTKEEVTL